MSADNWIYVALFPDGRRVVHTQAIENIIYYPEWTLEWEHELDETYGGLPVYTTSADAYNKAMEIEMNIMDSDFPVLEYWINYVGYFNYIPQTAWTKKKSKKK